MKRLLLGIIYLYSRLISPVFHAILGPLGGCRFHPGCAQYAREAIEEWGPWRGLWLALKRVVRCHPWSAAGSDPVPRRHPAERA